MAPSNADDILQQLLSDMLSSYATVQVFSPPDTQRAEAAAETNNTVAATAIRLWKGTVSAISSPTATGWQQGGELLVLNPTCQQNCEDPLHNAQLYLHDGLVGLLGRLHGEVTMCDASVRVCLHP